MAPVFHMTDEEIKADIEGGVDEVVDRGKIDVLIPEEKQKIFDIVTMPGKIVGVEPGKEIVMSNDSGAYKINVKSGIPVSVDTEVLIYERVLGCDYVDVGNTDYNYKTAKGVAKREASKLKNALNISIMPLFYGAMPNLGFYTKSEEPVDNWSVLLPEGRIKEAMDAQEEAVHHTVRDIVYVAEQMNDVGSDEFQLDTAGATGDADFLVLLIACEEITKKFPNMGIEMGIRDKYITMVGGAPCSSRWAKRIGADLYTEDAVEAAKKALEILNSCKK